MERPLGRIKCPWKHGHVMVNVGSNYNSFDIILDSLFYGLTYAAYVVDWHKRNNR